MTNGFRPTNALGNGVAGTGNTKAGYSRSSPGLTTRVGRTTTATSELDRSASLNLAARAMKLKMKTGKGREAKPREVSERRQVGDAESIVNPPATMHAAGDGSTLPWWRNVTMEEGL
ncbi:hypothetical protein LTR36_010737 [Oleoguttula mirabilis]|uniref:Uncharacterized protein n=1 Tax=Oleoguttula mirabilis TaxID=1507867 RepID=A0AAV9JSN3_9PEZI|nr:hypothetical protein LTR36_010737 [Oleoguttula mirabilis]